MIGDVQRRIRLSADPNFENLLEEDKKMGQILENKQLSLEEKKRQFAEALGNFTTFKKMYDSEGSSTSITNIPVPAATVTQTLPENPPAATASTPTTSTLSPSVQKFMSEISEKSDIMQTPEEKSPPKAHAAAPTSFFPSFFEDVKQLPQTEGRLLRSKSGKK